ncbi:tyrosine-type recombinase/integrase [Herminiimonas aquatilis]|uniref:Tyrosine-type recombinase/integrase n=1 Tax=Herminiimonas aquatilis TaxID=345342 RepID=A0ABW2J6R8_9BURK
MALNDAQIRAAKPTDKQYKLTDSEGMYLLVHPNGSKYWRLNYRFGGKQKTLAIGVYPSTPLAAAREKRAQTKQLLATGIDPGAKKKQEQFEERNGTSFEEVARTWHANNKKWSEAHRARILQSLASDIFPSFGKTNIKDLKTRDLLIPIKAVANSGRLEVASRLQQRVTSIMRYAVQSGLIDYNPAQDIAGTVPTSKTKHRAALDFERIPELLNRITNYKGRPLTQLAVELSLLIFIRSSEMRFGRWSEIDFDRAIWTIPGEREAIDGIKFAHRGAKMHTPHLVPLCTQALSLLRRIQNSTGNHDLIFTGDHNPKLAMSENTVNKALRTMGYDTKTEVCGHGFRTMACSALIESGLWSRDAVERQMSHQERNSVRAAYIHKAEHLDERRLMMQWWADYLEANKKKAISPFDFSKLSTNK